MASSKIFIGQVIKRGASPKNVVKIRYLTLVLDDFLKKYFSKRHNCWAVEKDMKVGIGDIVLINELKEQDLLRVRYEIQDTVYKLGAVVDPVTGRRCRGTEYIDEAERSALIDRIEQHRATKLDQTSHKL